MRLFKPLVPGNNVEIQITAMETPEAAFVAGSIFGVLHNTTYGEGKFSIEKTLEIGDESLVRDHVPDSIGISFLKGIQVALEDEGVSRV